MVNSQEGETFGKGYAFDTDEGPHELVEAMIDCGFGNTKEILRKLTKRDDFKDAVENFDSEDDVLSGELFDMRDLLSLSIESEVDDEVA